MNGFSVQKLQHIIVKKLHIHTLYGFEILFAVFIQGSKIAVPEIIIN